MASNDTPIEIIERRLGNILCWDSECRPRPSPSMVDDLRALIRDEIERYAREASNGS